MLKDTALESSLEFRKLSKSSVDRIMTIKKDFGDDSRMSSVDSNQISEGRQNDKSRTEKMNPYSTFKNQH
ncbi:hypothetical protein PRIPAC_95613 [Pristionchus pacificus]|uniref:Uncharacterized protein n=1 Tax=Pristionchus pacificus TaxID=54126 RepID=A0A2A6BK27_PRIPA|nr:hypothetical protein PRIPAC_95613 [Pristionchus pacificus]|eukprot:PDM66183.1 hypothetical protein PRIPAC_45408 [Pristionchus pacificus]